MASQRRQGTVSRIQGESRNPLRSIAALVAEINMLTTQLTEPITVEQVRSMTLRQLLQDPIRAEIFYRGFHDEQFDRIRRSMFVNISRGDYLRPMNMSSATIVELVTEPQRVPPTTNQLEAIAAAPDTSSAVAAQPSEAVVRPRTRKNLLRLKQRMRVRTSITGQDISPQEPRQPTDRAGPSQATGSETDERSEDILQLEAPLQPPEDPAQAPAGSSGHRQEDDEEV